jgi:hypothetical protein
MIIAAFSTSTLPLTFNLAILVCCGAFSRRAWARDAPPGLRFPRSAMDHHSSGYLPAEKFPTFDLVGRVGEQQRFQISVVCFLDPGRVVSFRKNHRHMGMDLCYQLIRLACDNRASASAKSLGMP